MLAHGIERAVEEEGKIFRYQCQLAIFLIGGRPRENLQGSR